MKNEKATNNRFMKVCVTGLVMAATCMASALTVPTPSATKGTYTSSIRISWNAVSGATKYQVRYGTSSSYDSSYALKTLSGTALNLTGVTAGRTYYFWVCPYDRSGSRWYNKSKYASGYAQQASRLSLSASGSTSSITLSWSVSGTAPSSYRVFRSVINNYSYATLVASCSSGARRYVDTRVNDGVPYYYWLCYLRNGTWYRIGSVSGRRMSYALSNGGSSGSAYISGSSTLRYNSSAKYYLYVGGKKVSATWTRSGQATMQSKGSYGLLKATNKPNSTFKVTVHAKYNGRTYGKTVTITR